jgi:antitoxin (DNA-binding transcriptional repressor) of toxin-antitoxin stability system
MTGRVVRIAVYVTTEVDGVLETHEAIGVPENGSTVAQIIPHHRQTFSRRTGVLTPVEVVDVTVNLQARLTANGQDPLFAVFEHEPQLLVMEEGRQEEDHPLSLES